MTTVQAPIVRARFAASATASSVSHAPGSRWPSQVTAAGRSLRTFGSPATAICFASISAR